MSWTELLSGIGGGGVTGFLTYLGTRRVAKESGAAADRQADLDSRRVGIDEFRAFRETYKEDQARDHKEMARLRGLLSAAIAHISSLRATMRSSHVPLPPLPDDLVNFSLGGLDATGD